jgi:UDP-GlcNAc:undecaprenyl-phosphate GlcNAc-1-phosphate transferase
VTGFVVALVATLVLGVILVVVPGFRRPLTRSASGPRWRADAVPVSGGIAMAVGCTAGIVAASPGLPGLPAILAASGMLLAMGVVDDLHPLAPRFKLVGQAMAGLVLAAGLRPDLPGGTVVEAGAVVVWVLIAVNAVNLLDGMDGLAGGIGLIAAATLWAWDAPAPLVAALAGSITGFLPFNLKPARMFMGNGGSHWLGVMLAAATIVDGGRGGGTAAVSVWMVLLVPAELLAVPLFDALFVTVERRVHGRSIMVGGTDHTAHRLVASGMTERRAVALLWIVGGAAAGAASLARLGTGAFMIGAAVMVVVLGALTVRVHRVAVYE